MSLFKKPEPVSVEIQGQSLKCLVCRGDEFYRHEAQLNTAFASLLNLDWTDASGICYACAKCGYIHWFLPR
jgi:predicted nucleic-acid-binding Zn-ribbon protein